MPQTVLVNKSKHQLENLKNIIKSQMKNITVEGAELMLDVGSLLLKTVGKKNLPLASLLLSSLKNNKKLKIDWKKFSN